MNKFKNILKNITLVISTIIICLFVIELLSTIFVTGSMKESGQIEEIGSSKHIRLKLFPPEKKWTSIPIDSHWKKTNGTMEQKDYLVQTDSFQSITSPSRGEPKPNSNNIIFLGGSTTETLFVDEELRWPLLTTKKINESVEPDWTGYNYGVSGNNLLHSSLIYFSYKRIIPTKIVVIQHLANDIRTLALNDNYVAENSKRHSLFVGMDEENNLPFYSFLQFLKTDVLDDTYLLARLAFPNIGLMVRKMVGFESEPHYSQHFNDDKYLEDIWLKYEHQLDEIIAVVKLNDATPVLLLQAINTNYKEHSFNSPQEKIQIEKVIKAHKLLNEKLKAKLLKENIDFIDLRPFGTDKNIYDLFHFNNIGSEKAASKISDFLINLINSKTP